MKSHLRFLILFSLLLALVAALCACEMPFGNDEGDPEIRAAYDAYAQYMKAEGKEPLDYESWIADIKGDKGDTGADGVGIAKIEKTATNGNVDTYPVTLTNGKTFTFTVANGNIFF